MQLYCMWLNENLRGVYMTEREKLLKEINDFYN